MKDGNLETSDVLLICQAAALLERYREANEYAEALWTATVAAEDAIYYIHEFLDRSGN